MTSETKTLQEFMIAFSNELRRMQYPITNITVITGKCKELETYAMSQNIWSYSVELGQQFLSTWYPVSGKFRTNNDVDIQTKDAYWAVGLLNDYLLHGVFTTMRRHRVSPLSAEHEIVLHNFNKYQLERGFAANSAKRYCNSIRGFLIYLDSNKIQIASINEAAITGYLSAYIDKSKDYLRTLLEALKRFATFAHETGLTFDSILKFIPSLPRIGSQHVPSVWRDGDVDKLLLSVDRGSPLGKRDYAILSLAAKLGLRSSDIKALTFDNIDWTNKRISIIQRKTGKQLVLPLTDDVGWAVIDYLKYGRPKSDFPNIFLRHVAPIGPFSEASSMNGIISRYRTIAGIDVNDRAKRGMHSLRHTFATKLLRENVPLETISELLGHVGMSSIDIYLSVETEALRCCALNPDEVLKYA